MIMRNLDANGDWLFGAGSQSYARKVDAIALNIRTRLRGWRGDAFSDLEDGVDWNNLIGRGTKGLLDLDIKRIILQSEGVLSIREGSYRSHINRDSRELNVECTVETIYGDIEVVL